MVAIWPRGTGFRCCTKQINCEEGVMKCIVCNSDNREGARFCKACGAKFDLKCPSCGHTYTLVSSFCDECGYHLRSPKDYTPQFLRNKILKTRRSIEGELKMVTVLFADVVNSTAFTESLKADDIHQIMDGAFKILMNEIHKYEGNINQFTGDGIMALFGAPIAHENHAQRACYAGQGGRDGSEIDAQGHQ